MRMNKRIGCVSGGRGERGIALLLVLLATAVASVMAIGFVVVQSTSAGMGDSVHHYAQARAVAEAAVSIALEEAKAGTAWRTTRVHGVWSAPVTMMGGVALVKYEDGIGGDTDQQLGDDDGDPFTITAMATVEGVTYTAVVEVDAQVYAGKLLMIVPTASSPNWQDQLLIQLFERWGYEVTLAGQNESAAQLLVKAAQADVVYVASSTSSGTVGRKITDSTAGIVAHEFALNDELGFNNAQVTPVYADRGDVVDNTHPVTRGLPVGETMLFDQQQSIRYLRGPLTPEAVLLAKHWSNSRPIMAAMERGAMTSFGDPAHGRRVLLTWTASADPSWLTDPHRQIIRQALEWAGSTPEEMIAGEDRELPGSANNVKGLMLATRVTTERDMELREIAALVKGPPSKKVRLAIYSDRNNNPDQLILQTDAVNATGLPTSFDWSRFSLDGQSLPEGTYWLVLCLDHQTQYLSYKGGGQLRYRQYDAIANGYPSSWAGSQGTMELTLAIYINGEAMVVQRNGTPLLFPRWVERTR